MTHRRKTAYLQHQGALLGLDGLPANLNKIILAYSYLVNFISCISHTIIHLAHVKGRQFYQRRISRVINDYNVINHSIQNKVSGSETKGRLYLFLLFLQVGQEFHHALGCLSYPLAQEVLGIPEGLNKQKPKLKPQHSNRDLFLTSGILVKVLSLQNFSSATLS